MYTLTLLLSWQLVGPIAELDNHPMYVDTLRGRIHLTGFKSLAACMAYKYAMPVALNGTPQPYVVAGRSCSASTQSAAAAADMPDTAQ